MDKQPCNTPKEEEIEMLLEEIRNLSQENAALIEQAKIKFPQVVDLEALRDRILFDLKLGKQAPGYKAAQKALNRFITKLIHPDRGVF
jgi:hypothetical protein